MEFLMFYKFLEDQIWFWEMCAFQKNDFSFSSLCVELQPRQAQIRNLQTSASEINIMFAINSKENARGIRRERARKKGVDRELFGGWHEQLTQAVTLSYGLCCSVSVRLARVEIRQSVNLEKF